MTEHMKEARDVTGFVVERPGGGISLNWGFPEILLNDDNTLMVFSATEDAVALMDGYGFDPSDYRVRPVGPEDFQNLPPTAPLLTSCPWVGCTNPVEGHVHESGGPDKGQVSR